MHTVDKDYSKFDNRYLSTPVHTEEIVKVGL